MYYYSKGVVAAPERQDRSFVLYYTYTVSTHIHTHTLTHAHSHKLFTWLANARCMFCGTVTSLISTAITFTPQGSVSLSKISVIWSPRYSRLDNNSSNSAPPTTLRKVLCPMRAVAFRKFSEQRTDLMGSLTRKKRIAFTLTVTESCQHRFTKERREKT